MSVRRTTRALPEYARLPGSKYAYALQSERDTIVRKLTNQLPSLKKYGPSSTGVETAQGRIRTSSKEMAQKSYMIGKK